MYFIVCVKHSNRNESRKNITVLRRLALFGVIALSTKLAVPTHLLTLHETGCKCIQTYEWPLIETKHIFLSEHLRSNPVAMSEEVQPRYDTFLRTPQQASQSPIPVLVRRRTSQGVTTHSHGTPSFTPFLRNCEQVPSQQFQLQRGLIMSSLYFESGAI